MTLTDSNPDLLNVARHSLAAASAVVAGNAVYVVERRRGPGRPTGASSGRYVRVDELRPQRSAGALMPLLTSLVLIAVAADASSTAARLALSALALAFGVAGLVDYLLQKARLW